MKYQKALNYQKSMWNMKLNSQPQVTPTQLEETFGVLQEAVDKASKYDEKETPMKPTIIDEPSLHYIYYCPDCGATLMVDRNKHPKHLFNYCGSCSKKLDWSEEDD